MNVLFPVKMVAILNKLSRNKKWIGAINSAKSIACAYPNDSRTRVILCSPQVIHVLRQELNKDFFRVRYSYNEGITEVYQSSIEVYSEHGELMHIINNADWSLALSLAIETEMLEILSNINPL